VVVSAASVAGALPRLSLNSATDRLAKRLAPLDVELTDPRLARRAFLVFLCFYVVVWTLYPTISRPNLDTHADMVENLMWGQEFRAGYYKHPPLFAWVTGVWFSLFPRADWAYFLLSALNTALAFAGTWSLIGLFDRSPRRLASVLFLGLMPLYTFLAIKFNANSVLLAVWPWLGWAMVRAVRSRKVLDGAALGALAALALLGKYYSGVFLLALFLASFRVHDWRRFYASPAFLAASVLFLLLVAPHVVWVLAHELQPIAYIDDFAAKSAADLLRKLASFALAQLPYHLPALLATAAALTGSRATFFYFWRSDGSVKERSVLLILGTVPFLATLIAALGGGIALSAVWGIPLWFLSGFLVLSTPRPDHAKLRVSILIAAVAIGYAGCLAASPLVRIYTFKRGYVVAVDPRREVSREVERLWSETASVPLRLVGGSRNLAPSMAFYAAGRPSVFTPLDFAFAPWVTPQRIEREGIAIVCYATDTACLDADQKLFGGRGAVHRLSVAKTTWGMHGPRKEVVVRIVPPRGRD
jgi:4-amino-4-deoxy-L-arabinose transferase-like glycosyltransferase